MNRTLLGSGVLLVVVASLAMHSYLSSAPRDGGGTIRVMVQADFGTSNRSGAIVMRNGSTAFDALNGTFNVTYQEFAGMGKLITAINGVAQNGTHYWFYYVDGAFAQSAADKKFLERDAAVLFRFMPENAFRQVIA